MLTPVTAAVVDGPTGTDAMAGDALIQVPPAGEPVHIVVEPAQIAGEPAVTPGVGVVVILAIDAGPLPPQAFVPMTR